MLIEKANKSVALKRETAQNKQIKILDLLGKGSLKKKPEQVEGRNEDEQRAKTPLATNHLVNQTKNRPKKQNRAQPSITPSSPSRSPLYMLTIPLLSPPTHSSPPSHHPQPGSLPLFIVFPPAAFLPHPSSRRLHSSPPSSPSSLRLHLAPPSSSPQDGEIKGKQNSATLRSLPCKKASTHASRGTRLRPTWDAPHSRLGWLRQSL